MPFEVVEKDKIAFSPTQIGLGATSHVSSFGVGNFMNLGIHGCMIRYTLLHLIKLKLFVLLNSLLHILQNNSNFDLNTLLKIASKNGAKALGFEELGTFEKGKIPGVNLIGNLDGVKVNAERFIQVI